MMRRTAFLMATVVSLACAFAPTSLRNARRQDMSFLRNHAAPPMMPLHAPHRKPLTFLQMSDIPTDDNDNWKDSLPPSPEDQLIMIGDIVALFVYSFLDHTLNHLFVEQTLQGHAEYLDPLGEMSSTQTPVWFDALHTTVSQEYLLSIVHLPPMYYSPMINTAGVASVVLTSCWLLSGWMSGAFLFRNTLECNTSRVLLVTGQTWLVTCAILVTMVFGMNHFVFDVEGILTKADADYIFDSLTVLMTWRFLVSYMLGYGK